MALVDGYGAVSGPVTAVLPGLGVSGYMQPAVRDLAAHVAGQVLLFNGPGFGGSDPVSRWSTVGVVAEAVRRFLQDLGQPVAALVGQSTGCLVAARVARAFPSASLVLVSPVVDPVQRSLLKFGAAWLRDGQRERAGLLAVEAPEWWRGRRQLRPLLKSCLSSSLDELLEDRPNPVTVVRGGSDPMARHEWVVGLADRPGGRIVVVPGGSHAFMFRRPDLLYRAVSAAGGLGRA